LSQYEILAVYLAAAAIVVSVVSVVCAWLARRDSRRSADAAQESVEENKRQFKLGIKPRVVAQTAKVEKHPRDRPIDRTRVILKNIGSGVASHIQARLTVSHKGGTSQVTGECSGLRPGEEWEVPGIGSPMGRISVWGIVTCKDAEGQAYKFECPKGGQDWHEEDPACGC
jgi:hypothetical protein